MTALPLALSSSDIIYSTKKENDFLIVFNPDAPTGVEVEQGRNVGHPPKH